MEKQAERFARKQVLTKAEIRREDAVHPPSTGAAARTWIAVSWRQSAARKPRITETALDQKHVQRNSHDKHPKHFKKHTTRRRTRARHGIVTKTCISRRFTQKRQVVATIASGKDCAIKARKKGKVVKEDRRKKIEARRKKNRDRQKG